MSVSTFGLLLTSKDETETDSRSRAISPPILASLIACLRARAVSERVPRCARRVRRNGRSAGGRAPNTCTHRRSPWGSGAAESREIMAQEPCDTRPRTSYRSRCTKSPLNDPRPSEGCKKAYEPLTFTPRC